MKDSEKTREQLIHELTELRLQNAAQEKSITENISAQIAAEELQHYAENIVETIRQPLLVLDGDLRIISANRNFYSTFHVNPGETLGCFIYDLGNRQWDIPKLCELLERVLPEREAFYDFEVDHNFQDIGQKIMLLNARQIYRKDIGIKIILLAIEDITKRKQLEDLLTESEERFRRLFETANDGIVLLEKGEGKITHANPASEKMTGYTSKESIGNSLQDIGIPLDLGDFQKTMQDLNNRGIIHYDDIPVITKTGQHIDTDIYLVDRAKLVQCNIRNITERKQASEKVAASLLEKETMLGEIHHRVKNNLQIISSLLNLQAKTIGDEKMEGIFRACQDRVASMAAVHQLLYESQNFAEINFGDYLRETASKLFQSYKTGKSTISLVIQAENVMLSIDTAIPCGLIINELVTNALKYAFPEVSKGEIKIEMRQTKQGISLLFEDNGIGFPKDVDFYNSGTLGLKLIHLLVEQLDGSIEQFINGGTRYAILLQPQPISLGVQHAEP